MDKKLAKGKNVLAIQVIKALHKPISSTDSIDQILEIREHSL